MFRRRLYRLLKKTAFDVQPLTGRLILKTLTASPKQCPDTKREFMWLNETSPPPLRATNTTPPLRAR